MRSAAPAAKLLALIVALFKIWLLDIIGRLSWTASKGGDACLSSEEDLTLALYFTDNFYFYFYFIHFFGMCHTWLK